MVDGLIQHVSVYDACIQQECEHQHGHTNPPTHSGGHRPEVVKVVDPILEVVVRNNDNRKLNDRKMGCLSFQLAPYLCHPVQALLGMLVRFTNPFTRRVWKVISVEDESVTILPNKVSRVLRHIGRWWKRRQSKNIRTAPLLPRLRRVEKCLSE